MTDHSLSPIPWGNSMLIDALRSFRQTVKYSSTVPRRRRRPQRINQAGVEHLESRTLLSAITFFQKHEGVDWTSSGAGGIGSAGGGLATINVGNVSGEILHAYLYWQGIDRGFTPDGSTDGIYDNETITFESNVVTGTSLGMGSAAISGTLPKSQAFRADVTGFIRTGIQTYQVAGLASKLGHEANGVSLVIVYQDGNAANDRDLYILNGNHVNAGFNSDREWSATLADFQYALGDVRAQLHVADGQSTSDATVQFRSSTGGLIEFEDTNGLYDGTSTPSMGTGRVTNGSLWDIHTFDISSIVTQGSQSLSLTQLQGTQDSIGLVALLFDTPAGASNSPPVASDLRLSGFEDEPISGQLPGFDPDGDPLTYSIVAPPINGQLQFDVNTGAFTFTPTENFYGEVIFTYQVADADSSSAIATIRLVFAAVNDAPVVLNASFTVPVNAQQGAAIGRVSASDVDGDALRYAIASGNDGGAFAIDAYAGTIFVADLAALRRLGQQEVLLTVLVTDPSGASASATITVRLSAPPVKIRVGFNASSTINLKGSPWLPLVVFSNDAFDVRDLDLRSLTFGRTGNEASLAKFQRPLHLFRDVDGDGKLDLVLLFNVRKTGLGVNDVAVTLKGNLKKGEAFSAVSSVTVTKGKAQPVRPPVVSRFQPPQWARRK